MSTRQDGGPAFPVPPPTEFNRAYSGMSLRDWFAGQAITGVICENPGIGNTDVAKFCYALADAMLAKKVLEYALEKKL